MVARGRRRRDANLGQIPLSSGEIELYSRQDEAARRRRRLLAVRDQERRLAQQVTQRYRQNLQRLQHGKSRHTHAQLRAQQNALLTELHRRYQNSLQSMGTAQRNARAKLLELMEQAHQEQEKWVYNRQVTGKERALEAQEDQEKETAARNARRRQVEQSMQRLKLLSGQQRRQASARAAQEQELAMQRAKDRQQLEKMRRMQSPEEVFVTPRSHGKDVMSYQFTRTHCVVPVSGGKEKSVTVIKHNRKHPTARRGEEEANRYRDEVDQRRERDRLVAEQQEETAAERGKAAVDDVTSRQQGQQTLEWLALVDKMERQARGQKFGGEDEYLLDVGEVDGVGDPKRMAERAFAQMLGLEDSMELSAFSIETDDDQSVRLEDTDRELPGYDEAVKANAEYRVKLKAGKYGGSFDSLDGIKPGRIETKYRSAATHDSALAHNAQKSLKETDDEQSIGLEDTDRELLDNDEVVKADAEYRVKPKAGKHGDSLGSFSERDYGRVRTKYGVGPGEREPSAPRFNGETDIAGDSRLGNSAASSRSSYQSRRYDMDDPHYHNEAEHEAIETYPENLMGAGDVGSPMAQRKAIGKTARNDEVDPKAGQHTLDHSADDLWRSSAEERATGPRDSRNLSVTGRLEETLVEHEVLSSSVAATSNDELHQKPNTFADIAGASQLGNSASSRSSYHQSGRYDMDDPRYHNEAGHEAIETYPENLMGAGDVGSPMAQRKAIGKTARNDEVNPKAGQHTLDHSADDLWRSSAEGRATEPRDSRNLSVTGRLEETLVEHDEVLSSSVAATSNDELHQKPNTLDEKLSRVVDVEEGSVSASSFASSQKFISRRDQVAKVRARSLGQRFIDQHKLSVSSSEGLSGDEGEVEGDLSRSSFGSDDVHPSVNINPYDPYRQQIGHQTRRSSTSAVSVDQYSLPPSDTQTSFDDSLDQLHPGYGEDSFVNELVPMFPKRALPHPFEEDSQTVEEYDVQLVAPNMSRMLTSERRISFGRSRQHLVHQDHQTVAAIDHSRRQSEARREEFDAGDQLSQIDKMELSPHSRSSARSSNNEMDVKSVGASMGEPKQHLKQQQRAGTKHTRRTSTRPTVRDSRQYRQADTVDINAEGNLSEISDSDSGVSSLGFAVQLNLAAGTTRRRNDGDGRREPRVHGASQRSMRADASDSADDPSNEDNISERSYASSSSMSMDAHFNYLASITSAVGKSLPLHLRLPAVVFGKKDMTKPPVPIVWSASSESSIASASEVNATEAVERGFPSGRRSIPRSNWSMSESLLDEQQVTPPRPRSIPRSNSSMSESLLEEQQVTPPRPTSTQRKPSWQVRGGDSHHSSASSHQSKALGEGSYRESTDESEQAEQLTLKDIKENVAMLPPPPLGSLDMTRPPTPLQNLEHSFAWSGQSYEDFQSAEKRQTRDHGRRPYEGEDERKSGDSSSTSGASSHSDGSSSSSYASLRRQSMRKAAKIVISVNNNDDEEAGEKVSLAEAFKRRHPSFGHRADSHRDKLKRHRDQQQQQRQQEPEQKTPAKHDAKKSEAAASVVDQLPPEQQELLDRLATGGRAKISSREMKERSRRLYHQLPEVVERRRQEEVMHRRRERLNELREQEKERRLQQKQRRQQQH